MSAAFDREALLDAFDRIGHAAAEAGTKLHIAVYGGSALMLASNFRFATEDVDVSKLERPLPDWLATVVREIAEQNGWQEDWFNDGVAFHLSSLASSASDHLEFGTFPRDGEAAGLVVLVPSAKYLLALKLTAFRIMDPVRGEAERLDILNLMQVVGISTADEAIALLGRYFPLSAASSERQRFLLKNMNRTGAADAPSTLAEAVERIQAGSAHAVVLAEFIDAFDLAKTDHDRYAAIEREPKLTGDGRIDALVGAIAEYLAKQRRLGRVPHWVCDSARRLDHPWFTTADPSDAMREFLTFSSPAEFASRNIFTEERPLRRARGRFHLSNRTS